MKNIRLKNLNLFIFTLFLSCFFIFTANQTKAYTPPIGIPNPADNWGSLDPIEQVTPNQAIKCPSWPTAASVDCYYVEPLHAQATDTANTQGYPNKPRLSIPGNKTYMAGSYVYVAGQQTILSQNIKFNCSEANPCWITSDAKTIDSTGGGGFSGNGRISIAGGTQYLFIENLLINNKIAGEVSSGVTLSNTASTVDHIHHVSVRGIVAKDIAFNASSSVIVTNARDGGTSHDIILYNNTFKNVGDPDAVVDQDLHSVGMAIRDVGTTTESYNLWFLENHCSDSTQCLQINGGVGGVPKLHHIYVGKNYGEHERQRSLSTKQASHVIFSQNEVFPGVNRAAGGYSEGMGWSLGADYVWFLFNNVHNGTDGFRNSDSTGGASSTSRAFIIGNIVHDLSINEYINESFWPQFGNAINLEKGGSTVHVVDNIFYNVPAGIKTAQPDTILYASGNITEKSGADHHFINFYSNTPITNVHVANNLYWSATDNKTWANTSSIYTTLVAWQAGLSPTVDIDSVYGDPLVDVNYFPTAGSPTIAANSNEFSQYGYPDVYALFESLYGIDIRVDYNNNPRPVGPWTLGAFEYNSDSTAPNSPTNLSVL